MCWHTKIIAMLSSKRKKKKKIKLVLISEWRNYRRMLSLIQLIILSETAYGLDNREKLFFFFFLIRLLVIVRACHFSLPLFFDNKLWIKAWGCNPILFIFIFHWFSFLWIVLFLWINKLEWDESSQVVNASFVVPFTESNTSAIFFSRFQLLWSSKILNNFAHKNYLFLQ